VRAGFGVRAALILIGFTAAVSQIVLLRELMVVFDGNEISIGLMLASWLFWTAAGSSLAGRVAARPRNPWALMAATQMLIAAVLPATVMAVRAAKGVLQTVPGEVLGPGPMLLTSLAALGPLCILSGALFTAGSRLFATATSTSAGAATGSVYLREAVGSSGGGLLAGLVLVRYLGALEIACLLAVLNLVAASALAIERRPQRNAAVATVAGVAAVLILFRAPQDLEQFSQRLFWRGQHLVATRNSVYGKLAVVEMEGSRSVYENGVVLFNVPDPAGAEEAVHYALLEHPSPRTLLLIGGGFNGSISQALRHPSLERVDYVELDPAILDLAHRYFPNQWRAVNADPRVRIHVTDGRLFLKTASSTFDVAIVNLPDPRNAQLNRFYTVDFFREVSQRLTPTGLLSFQLTSSEDYIGPELGAFLRSIHKSLRAVFPEVTAIPGETVHFFAARRPGILVSRPDELLARLHSRHLETSYVSEYFIPFRMAPDRMLEFDAEIRPLAETPVNRDFAPVAYYFDIALWSSQFHQGYRRFFRVLAGIPFETVAVALAVFLAAVVVAGRWRKRRLQFAAACSTAATGFTMIGLEMLLLLAFQALYGYVYQQLAVLIAAFMAGMAVGSWLAMRKPARAGMRVLATTQVLTTLAPLVLLALFEAIGRASGTPSLAVSRLAFPAMALISGMLGGFEFPVASRIFFGAPEAPVAAVKSPGTLYALDLAGSCLGAILFSAWLVPVFGFLRTALLSAMVSLAPAAMAMLAAREANPAAPATPSSSARRTPGR